MTAHPSKPPHPPAEVQNLLHPLHKILHDTKCFNVGYIQNTKMSGFYSLPFASIAAKTSGISKVNAAACTKTVSWTWQSQHHGKTSTHAPG